MSIPRSRHVAFALAGALACTAVLAANGQAPTPPQQGQPTFRAGAMLVPLDVRVVDRNGRPVTGLTRDDFVVLEDGVVQTLAHFESYSLTPQPPGMAPQPSMLAAGLPRASNRRIVYVELGRMWLGEVGFGFIEALTTFLRASLLPQDYAVVSSFGRMTGLTNDHEALAQVVERLSALHRAVKKSDPGWAYVQVARWRLQPPDSPIRLALDQAFAPATPDLRLSLRPESEFSKLLDQVASNFILSQPSPSLTGPNRGGGAAARAASIRQVADILRTDTLVMLGAVQYLRFLEGEKHLLTFAVGAARGAVEDDRALARVASEARVSIHALGVGGIARTGRVNLNAEMAAKNLTGWTGGAAFFNRWPKDVFTTIDALTRTGYLVAYSPDKPAVEDRYRRISVRVKRHDDAKVLVRESYLSTPSPPVYDPVTFTAKQHMLTVAAFPGGFEDLHVQVRASSSARAIATDVIVDLSRVSLGREADRHIGKLEVAVFCTDQRERLVGQRWITLDLKLRDDTLAAARASGLVQRVEVPVTGSTRYVKAVVYDYGTTRAGAAVTEIR